MTAHTHARTLRLQGRQCARRHPEDGDASSCSRRPAARGSAVVWPAAPGPVVAGCGQVRTAALDLATSPP